MSVSKMQHPTAIPLHTGSGLRARRMNGSFRKAKTPEVLKLQELKYGGGGPLRTGKEDILSGSDI